MKGWRSTRSSTFDLRLVAAVAAGDHVSRLDLALANGLPFLNVASVGLSVATAARVSHRMKHWLGPAAYAFAGALDFANHAVFSAKIESPGGTVEQEVHHPSRRFKRILVDLVLADLP